MSNIQKYSVPVKWKKIHSFPWFQKPKKDLMKFQARSHFQSNIAEIIVALSFISIDSKMLMRILIARQLTHSKGSNWNKKSLENDSVSVCFKNIFQFITISQPFHMMDNAEHTDIYFICKTMLEDVSLEYNKILFVKKITDLYFNSYVLRARMCVCVCAYMCLCGTTARSQRIF